MSIINHERTRHRLVPFFRVSGKRGVGFFVLFCFVFFFLSGRQGMSMVGWNGAVIFIVIKRLHSISKDRLTGLG